VRFVNLNFFFPMLITLLFIHELTGSLVVSTLGCTKETWEVARLGVVVVAGTLRLLTFREELQF